MKTENIKMRIFLLFNIIYLKENLNQNMNKYYNIILYIQCPPQLLAPLFKMWSRTFKNSPFF